MKIWYVPCHFFSLINYVHTHYIHTNINSSFQFFVIENKFKNKLKFPISSALPLLWILWMSTCIFNDAKIIEIIDYMLFGRLKLRILH